MNANLEAIDSLSQQYEDNIKREPRLESAGIIILIKDDKLIAQGEKILNLYMAEADKSDDPDANLHLAVHHARMGVMYSEAIYPRWITTNNPTSGMSSAQAAQRACQHYYSCWELSQLPVAAGALGDTFSMAGFYATALHWYSKAEQAATEKGQSDAATKIRAQKLLLESEGKTSDTILSADKLFPTRNTSGLMLENQPPPSSQSTLKSVDTPAAAKGGCASVLVCIFILVPAWAAIFTK